MKILGVSAFFHDAAAALVDEGTVVAAAQEERFSRKKHDPNLPFEAIRWCLEEGGVSPGELDAVAYYEKPLDVFTRLMSSYRAAGPSGLRTFPAALSQWATRKLWVAYELERALRRLGHPEPGQMLFAEHHLSHAANAYYCSPYDSACVLTFDGVGEWTTSSIGVGHGRHLELLTEMRYPDSLGLLYSIFTFAAGFKVNSGESKLMGLAPFGEPTYRDRILEELVDLRDDGSFRIDLRKVGYLGGWKMTNRRFDQLFGRPREPDGAITQRERDLARSIQEVTEEILLNAARHAHRMTGSSHAVIGGGVALNCVANGRLSREGPFDSVWVPPAPGDAGSAIGAALWAWHGVHRQPRPAGAGSPVGPMLGPRFDADLIEKDLIDAGRPYERIRATSELARRVATRLAEGSVVAVLTGPMEFGPRALGNRSILADPRDPKMAERLNAAVKRREAFRPFAPAVLAEHAAEWFCDAEHLSPHMSVTTQVRAPEELPYELPAVTHVDRSARVQTVDQEGSPFLHAVLTAFFELTGCPVLVNTSFNVRGEPIVCTPDDAYRCFRSTDIDWLVLEQCLLAREDQPPLDGPPPSFPPD